MNVLVIGAGSIGRRHILNLIQMGHHVEVAEIDPARRENIKNAAVIHSDVPSGGFDAAVICVPSNRHIQVLDQCIWEGWPCYVEKPLAHDTDIDRLIEIDRTAGRVPVVVGYQLRFHESVIAMKRRHFPFPLSRGRLVCHCNMDDWEGSSGRSDFLLELSHEIDLALYLGGYRSEFISSYVDFDNRSAIIEFSGWVVDIYGSSDTYLRSWERWSGDGSRTKTVFNASFLLGNEMYVRAMRSFLTHVRTGSARDSVKRCTLGEAIRVLDVIRRVRAAS